MASRAFLSVALIALLATAAIADWKIVDPNFATIAMSCAFQTATSGWVAGSTASLQPLLLYTTNGGQNFTNAPSDMKDGAFMSIGMFDTNHGIAGGLGFFGLPCGAATNNGTWFEIHAGRDFICAFQSADAVTQSTFVLTGAWASPGDFDGNGVQISSNGGNSWTMRNWNQGTDARYSSFLSSTTGYVSGGMWPSTSAKRRLGRLPYHVNRYLSFDGKQYSLDHESILASSQAVDGYQAVLAMTTDGGKTFQTVLNMTNQGVYFNEIDCIDVNTCWVAAEGVDSNLQPVAYIYATTNGFKTVTQQLKFPSGSLVTVNFVNSTYGWVGGAVLPSNFLNQKVGAPLAQFEGTAFQTTDGGKTWTQNDELKNFYFMQISTVDSNNAYGSGITSLGLSSLARYTN